MFKSECSCGESKKGCHNFSRAFLKVLAGILLVYLIVYLGALTSNKLREFKFIGRAPGLPTNITVDGEGKVTSVPNLATVSVGAVSEKTSVGAAQQENSQKINKLLAELKKLGIEDKDIHIHVPAGGIPKDGPSAGITIATAILSSLMKLPIRREFVMTGEITLRGRVLPVGGIKEKVLAAQRSSIFKVILPKENENDVKEIPEHIRKKMKFYYTEEIGKIFPLVIKSFNRRKATLTLSASREKEASL